jgi:hypothetical protein
LRRAYWPALGGFDGNKYTSTICGPERLPVSMCRAKRISISVAITGYGFKMDPSM